MAPVDESADQLFAGDDWYGRDLADARFVGCTFREVDLTEARSRGAAFERCAGHGAVVEVPGTDRPD